jgi:hypothetical protein
MTLLIAENIKSACAKEGCPICRLVDQGVRHFVQGLFYENVNDPPVRAQLRASLGFCITHARMMLEPGMGEALGISIIYHDILKALLNRLPDAISINSDQSPAFMRWLNRSEKSGDRFAGIDHALKVQAPCLVCEQQIKIEQLHLDALVTILAEDEFVTILAGSQGLCLPHFVRAMSTYGADKNAERLLQVQRDCIRNLQAELVEFVRKNDYRFSDEGFGQESDAWKRALRLFGAELP